MKGDNALRCTGDKDAGSARIEAADERPRYKTVLLGLLGKELSGSALGVLVAKFVLWCGDNGCLPVLDFRGVERVGGGFIESAVIHYEDYFSSGRGEAVKVIFEADKSMRGRDDVESMCEILSKPPDKMPIETDGEEYD